jgi:hypothetical protein
MITLNTPGNATDVALRSGAQNNQSREIQKIKQSPGLNAWDFFN